jgi:hypothetical protein
MSEQGDCSQGFVRVLQVPQPFSGTTRLACTFLSAVAPPSSRLGKDLNWEASSGAWFPPVSEDDRALMHTEAVEEPLSCISR